MIVELHAKILQALAAGDLFGRQLTGRVWAERGARIGWRRRFCRSVGRCRLIRLFGCRPRVRFRNGDGFRRRLVLWGCFESRRDGWSLDRANWPLRRLLVLRRRAWVRFRNGHSIDGFRQRCAGIVGNAVCGNRWLGLRYRRTLHGTCGLRHRRGSLRIVLGRRNDVGRLRQLLIVDRRLVVGLCRGYRCREGSNRRGSGRFFAGRGLRCFGALCCGEENSFSSQVGAANESSGGKERFRRSSWPKPVVGSIACPWLSTISITSGCKVEERLARRAGHCAVTRRSLPGPPPASRRASACRADSARCSCSCAASPR